MYNLKKNRNSTNIFNCSESHRNDKVDFEDDNGEELRCEYTSSIGWHAMGDQGNKCHKRVSYYQWVPYVLFLQVSSTAYHIIMFTTYICK